MAKTRRKKLRTFNFDEFKKEFYTKNTKKNTRKKSRLYELGVRMARESLAGSEAEMTSRVRQEVPQAN